MFEPSIREERAQEFSTQAFLQLVKSVLKRNALFRMRASGYSMFPFICDQDIVTIAPLMHRPRIGDVAVFEHPTYHRLAIHRIVGRRGDFYLLRGDNSRQFDGWLHRDQLFGHVIGLKRNEKNVSFGLGIERIIVAMMSRMKVLIRLRKNMLFFRPLFRWIILGY